MKVNMIYVSNTGHTEEMAETVKEAMEEKGFDVQVFTDEADGSEFAEADLLVFGSPACGTEEVDDSIIMPTIESIPSLEGKKVYMFGSFGWGDGEYMDTWKEEMESKGAEVVADPVVCLEEPDDEVKEQLRAAVDNF